MLVTGRETCDLLTLFDFFFFFFQAEDGIRDKLVTGVQTCALPISPRTELRGRSPRSNSGKSDAPLVHRRGPRWPPPSHPQEGLRGQARARTAVTRSEERRVGEEGRSRWSPYH